MERLTLDLIQAISLLTVATLIVVLYFLRVFIRGAAHFERVDRQGGSLLLHKSVMEMAYWSVHPAARLLVSLKIRPNTLSWLSLLFGLVAGICLAFGHFGSGAVWATISALLDSLDGMVARLRNVASDAGEVLDAAIDRYVEFFFIAGLVIYYREIPVLMLVAMLALIGSFMVSYSTAKAEALQVEPPKGSMRRPERAVYLTLGALLSPITIPYLERVREYPVAIGHPMVLALALVAILANLSAVERLWAIARRMRERERARESNVSG